MNQGSNALTVQLQQFLGESLPLAAVLHSYLADLRWNTTVGRDPGFEEFSENAVHLLHHHIALWGALQRAEAGDPAAWSSIGLNLARLLYRYQVTMDQVGGLPEAFRAEPWGQAVLQILEYEDRMIRNYLPAFRRVIMATG